METFVIPAFLAIILGVLGGFLLHHWFLNLLKTRHPEEWDKLGMENLTRLNETESRQANDTLIFYVMKKEYQALQDAELTKAGNILRTYSIAFLFVFAAAGCFLVWFINHCL